MCKVTKRVDEGLVGFPAHAESVITGKKHLKVVLRHDSGISRILVTAKTPSDHRARKNERAMSRRLVKEMEALSCAS